MKTPGAVVMGIAPGLAAFGWSLVRLTPRHEEPMAMGVIRTRQAYGQGPGPVSTDMHRRGRELAGLVAIILRRERPVAICAKALSVSRSASQMQSIGRAWGVVDAFATVMELPVVECSDDAIRTEVAGHAEATSDDVERALVKRYPHTSWAELMSYVPDGQREHAFEALGAVVACSTSNVCRVARRMVG